MGTRDGCLCPKKSMGVGTGTGQLVVPEMSSAGERDVRSRGGQMWQHGAGRGQAPAGWKHGGEQREVCFFLGQGANGE